jgi:3-oxoacyl-[acyl-carrier-protein] synthase-1
MPRDCTVVIVGQGAQTAIGMTAAASAAAVRAGVSGFAQHPFVVDTAGNRMIVACAPYLSIDVTGAERLATLAAPAAAEAIAALGYSRETALIPVFVGLPPARPGRSADVRAVAERLSFEVRGRGMTLGRVGVIEAGHAAGMMAVQSAWEAVRTGTTEFALAGGVDSYMEPETLEWLEANDQVHSAGPDNNPYGFIPGEASGFVLLASEAAAHRCQLTAALELSAMAYARERNLIKTDAVCTGEGMTVLFRMLAGEPPVYRADHLFCDMNGEPYRADEFGFATIRGGELFLDASSFTTPADCWGDVGAASGPLFLMLADAAVRKGYAPGPVLAGFTSSESGERCGFVVRSGSNGGLQ